MLSVWRIVAEVADEVAPADVQHRAGRNDAAKTDLEGNRPIENRGQQGAALAEEGPVASSGSTLGKGGIQARHRIHDPQAIRPNQAGGASPQLLADLALQFCALEAPFFE